LELAGNETAAKQSGATVRQHPKKQITKQQVICLKKSITKNKTDTEFDRMLCEAIKESLDKLLGENGTQSVLYFADQAYDIQPDNIANNIEDFKDLLEEIFLQGAILIEQEIMERLYSKLRKTHNNITLNYEHLDQFEFTNYITDLKTEHKKINQQKTDTNTW
jgi:hypothetical protein